MRVADILARNADVTLTRRASLQGIAAGGVLSTLLGEPSAFAEPRHKVLSSPHFEVRDVKLPAADGIAERCVMLVPRHTKERVPLLVLLHGLGETGDQRMGAYAWIERYGLGSSYERLLTPPVAPMYSPKRHWQQGRIEQLNQSLQEQPFRGLCIMCPYTPNVYQAPNRKVAFDSYTRWLTEQVVPYARKHAHVHQTERHTYLDGCSLGGYVGIEVFLRAHQHFCAWGSVQGALGAHRVDDYARRLAKLIHGDTKRFIHLETSSADPFRKLNKRLSAQLKKHNIAHDFSDLKGPHNQPFLRDSGTLEMLLWHDRRV